VTDLFMTAEITGSWIFWVLLGVLCATRANEERSPPVIENVPAAARSARTAIRSRRPSCAREAGEASRQDRS